ncbi:hypothetical protein MPSEU_000680900 [Mayamaea pseudoterrestris]|nr:hypothetical protein MPSEU_000680900 [Mayamaea pseudoterrestris]
MRVFALLTVLPVVAAFSSSFTSTSRVACPSNSNNLSMEYIPAGMSKDQWRKIKEAEKSKTKGKNLGAQGITTFKSRSFYDWQKSGGVNLFPVDPTKAKDPSELPYMQRPGGKPDNSDLKKKNPFGFFGNTKKKAEAVEAEKPPSTNWWTLK